MNNDNRIEHAIHDYCAGKPNIKLSIGISDHGHWEKAVYCQDGIVNTSAHYRYEIGSCTKVITASIIAKLLQEGKITLSDTLDCFFAEKLNNNPTIEQLLTHTAGFGAYPPIPKLDLISGKCRSCNPYENYDELFIEKSIISFHSTKYQNKLFYSNFGYAVLGLIIEKTYQQDFNKVMDAHLKNELHLMNTGLDLNENLLCGYNKGKGHGNWNWNPGPFAAAGGLRSDIDDMLYFLDLYHSSDRSYFITMLNQLAIVNEKSQVGIAMAWFKKGDFYYHPGGTGCFESIIAMNRASGKSAVILSNDRSYRRPYQSIIQLAILLCL